MPRILKSVVFNTIIIIIIIISGLLTWGFIRSPKVPAIQTDWEKYTDVKVASFEVPTVFERQVDEGTKKWLDPVKKNTAILYKKETMEEGLTVLEKVNKNVVHNLLCEETVTTNGIVLLKSCPYIYTKFDFIFWQADDSFMTLRLDHQYLDSGSRDYLIKSIKIWQQ